MTIDKGIFIQNVYYMLTYAFRELNQNNYEDIKGEKFENIFDLLGEILYKATAYQLKQGLHKEYVNYSDALTTVKGKIDVMESIALRRRHNLKIQCEFDEFSEDNLYNRIIKTTLDILLRIKDIRGDRRKKIKNLLFFFSDISECDLKNIRWKDIKYDHNSCNYRMIHWLCYFIAKRLLLTTAVGPYSLRHFQDQDEDMSHLFEKFVLNYYRRHYSPYDVSAAKVEWNVDMVKSTQSLLPDMQTDIKIKFTKRTLIIDTKYYGQSLQNNMGKRAIRNSHLYQIQSYVFHEDRNCSGTVDGMILYARTQEEIVPDGQLVFNSGNRIYFRNLDLNQKFDKIRKQLDEYIESYL